METFRKTYIILFSLSMGFGLWYLIFFFVSNEKNAFVWSLGTKIFYVILSILTSEAMLKNLGFDKNDIV
jgi:hypothetical protein